MATRLRKTRKFRGSRTHGWGQIGQHRASGHKGGLGQAGMHKHLFSSLLKDDPDHFGHDSTHPPHPIITKKWTSVRDLDDIFAKHGKQEGGKKLLDLASLGYDKLLGGGQVKNAYSVKIGRYTESAAEKIKQAGGEVLVVE
ncbi:MAG: 50S ribosomal protein L15 [Nitrososphaeria archaeon]|nr:50S ribosomal protein L15 [Nitrososphaeria archaeon]NDB50606.1 50S ribosomal protein L15 [Nitrosopumilaceae archaeon]NDB87725.1 50S ribosomal protein L15 [Nitrososphaerota archaeon]NDB45708.1 50S ribosomal protein L15 [Nitrososphaeria archaeon]NDB62369.1 50S ribosomal protein L15 [Nitrosopumilaceae archaeon]